MNSNNRQGIDALPTERVKELEEKQKKHGMIEKIYYDREIDGSAACVVLLAVEGVNRELQPVARGVAICSPLDTFNRAKGRVIARGRALRAIKRADNTGYLITRKPVSTYNVAFNVAYGTFGFKSEYQPPLTAFEKELLKPLAAKKEK